MVKINKKIDMNRLPQHVAFIMDGNRRWAKAKGLARRIGHEVGYKSMTTVAKRCAELGIKYMSVFAWSTENWGRSEDEVNGIFGIIREKIKDVEQLMQYGIRLMTMGDITRFPKDLQNELTKAIEKTKNNNKCVLTLCINYGGRADIVQAINKIKPGEKVTEESFEKYLFGADLPDIDFLVRTSGEQRISNFMLWKMAYSEIYFTKCFWPTVNEKFVDNCVIEFQKRKRRFGKDLA